MAIDLNSLEYQYRRGAGSHNGQQSTTYAIDFSSGGQNYTFIPSSVLTKGSSFKNESYVLPWFLDQKNIDTLAKTGQYVDLAGQSWYGDYLKDTVGASTDGFLIPKGSLPFDSKVVVAKSPVLGVGKTNEGFAYILEKPSGTLGQYVASDGKVTTLKQTEGRSLFGKTFGSWFDDFTKATGIQKVAGEVNDFFQTDLGKAVKVAALAASLGGSGMFDTAAQATTEAAATEAGAQAATEAAATEAGTQAATQAGATASPVVSGTVASTNLGTLSGSSGLLSNAALDAQFIAADAAQLSAQGLSSAQIASTLEASGVSSMVAADAAQLAAQGLTANQIASTITQGMPTATGATGASGLFNAGTAAGATAAAGTAAGAAAGAGMSDLAKTGLIQGGLGLVGGLLQGEQTKAAMEADAAARAKLAAEVRDMGKFQPVGTTTRFGTSSFVTDPTTGAITPSYTLSPEALAYQNSLSALGTQGLAAGQTMMNLGQQYVGESPEAVRQRYIATQNALLAPGNEQALAGIRTNLANTGRQGLAYGATEAGGMGATNPELAAYYNSLANQQRQLAAASETQYQNQVNFGAGLMGQATTPFSNVFTAQKGVEAAGQQPLEMSTNFANTVATRGAAQGANYAQAMNPSLQSSYNAANYNPYATALQGAGSNPLVGYGLLKAWS